jgi:hypothetical protein
VLPLIAPLSLSICANKISFASAPILHLPPLYRIPKSHLLVNLSLPAPVAWSQESEMGSRAGCLSMVLLLLAASVLSLQAAGGGNAASGETEHAVQQHSERISGILPLSFIHFIL